MMWTEHELERKLQEKLYFEFPENKTKVQSIFSDYVKVREKAIEISSKIGTKEKNLTDHSPEHIANVMDNAYKLIEDKIDTLNFAEIYFLCIIIMLHDVGNIEGRNNHQNKISEIYKDIRGKESIYKNEKNHVLKAVSSHCGEFRKGDRDTLKYLSESTDLLNKNLKLRQLAAILRFADELAEGPQRTSDYLLAKGRIAKKSTIFHVYAQITNVYLDKERISVSYNIDVDDKEVKKIGVENLLNYIYSRIIKIDEERRYCKYYSDILSSFKQIQIVFNINKNDAPLDIGISDIQLKDKFNLSNLGEDTLSSFLNEYPQLEINKILDIINISRKP